MSSISAYSVLARDGKVVVLSISLTDGVTECLELPPIVAMTLAASIEEKARKLIALRIGR